MSIESSSQRLLFTSRNNGKSGGHELAEESVERLDEHERPVGDDAEKRNWFGKVDHLAAALPSTRFPPLDIEGILSTLKVKTIATRLLKSNTEGLLLAGFVALGSPVAADKIMFGQGD